MKESEKLKENTERQFVNERLDELFKHVDLLLDKSKFYMKIMNRMLIFLTLVLIGELLAYLVFKQIQLGHIFSFILNLGLLFFWIVVAIQARVIGELGGIFKTLEILHITKGDPKGRKKKYKESLLSKIWEKIKIKKRKEAYAG